MPSSRGSYPHPVLDSSDDVQGDFEVVNAKFESGVDDIEVTFETRISNAEYRELIASGRAAVVSRWKSSSTLIYGDLELQPLRKTIEGERYVGHIPQEQVNRDIRVEVKIVALEAINGLSLQSHHEAYGGASFALRVGDVLGDAGYFMVNPDKAYDPLQPPLTACMVFEEVEGLTGRIDVSLAHEEYIVVQFPKSTLQGFDKYRVRPDLQLATVVLPVLIEVLWQIRMSERDSSAESFEDRAWFRAIDGLIERTKCRSQDPIVQAQKILEDPIGKSFARSLFPEDDEE